MKAATVSVVVPCKASERTIRQTVDSLLGQDYPALTEVILVGDAGDSSWGALRGVDDARLRRVEVSPTKGRDANVKRALGLSQANGQYLALVDSDTVVPPDWLSRAVRLLDEGAECVAGCIRSFESDFWGRFVDDTRLAAKTPRLRSAYFVTATNFGRRGRKPPITANLVFTRTFHRSAPLDDQWDRGYEDYEWLWRATKTGLTILFTDEISMLHHHRRSFRDLAVEYWQAARGCAAFIKRHPASPLARKRWLQAMLLPPMVAAVGVLCLLLVMMRQWPVVLAGGLLLLGVTMAYEWTGRRRVELLVYPVIAALLGGVFLAGMLTHIVSRPPSPSRRVLDPELAEAVVVSQADGVATSVTEISRSASRQ